MSRIPDPPSPPGSGASPPLSEPVFYILYALADQPRHGYGILLEIEGRTEGSVVLLPRQRGRSGTSRRGFARATRT